MKKPTRLAQGAGAAIALLVLVVGVPYGLWLVAGWPLPHSIPNWGQLTQTLTQPGIPDTILLDALAIVCWFAWCVLFVSLATEIIAVARGHSAPRLMFAGPLQTLVAGLVATVIVAVLTTSSRSATPSHPVLMTAATEVHAPAITAPVVCAADGKGAPVVAQITVPNPSEYTVQPRDTLWGIAESHLGNPLRWREIFDINKGRPQANGSALTEGRLIRPGWVLQLPVMEPVLPVPTLAAPVAPSAPSKPTPTPVKTMSSPVASVRTTGNAKTTVQAAASSTSRIELPDGSVVGLTLATGIGTALVGARLHRRHRRKIGEPRPGMSRTESGIGLVVRRLRREQLHLPRDAASVSKEPATSQVDGVVELGPGSAQPVRLNLLETSGMAVTGEGGMDVARAALLSLMTSDQAVEIRLADPDTAKALVPGAANFPAFQIEKDVESALSAIEVELVLRTRLLDSADAADASEFRTKRPHEPFPFTVLIAGDIVGTARQRVEAVASIGRRLDLAVLLLGASSSASTVNVRSDGVVEEVTGKDMEQFKEAQLFMLTAGVATECLAVVAESRGAETVQQTATADDSSSDADAFVLPVRAPSTDENARLVDVSVLGTFRITAKGTAIRTGLRTKARELLAYLILHPQGVAADVAVELLWPEGDADRGMEYFRAIVGNIRKVLRTAAGRADAMFIEWRGDRYAIDPELIDSDLWRVQSALAQAAGATEDGPRVAALDEIGHNCGGDLLDGTTYEWAEPMREDVRRRAVDGLVRLAELQSAASHNDRALTALEHALRIDPFSEELYRRIMHVQAQLERPDAIRRTYRLLEKRLTELDADPDDATVDLFRRLTSRPTSVPA